MRRWSCRPIARCWWCRPPARPSRTSPPPSGAIRRGICGWSASRGPTARPRPRALLAAILDRAGQRTGWLTTVDVKIGDEIRPNTLDHTTPEADRVQEVLAEMAADRVETAILEVSSHALALDRVRGCEFDLAIFTNLSPEHLNFHGTMDEYARAKARLFAMLGEPSAKPGPRVGIVNADDPASSVMREHCPAAILTYGIEHRADVMAQDVRLGVRGATFRLVTPRGEAQVVSQLLGRFNVANWLAATTAALELGATLDDVVRAAAETRPVPGRMERVDHGQPYLVVVDFAHTPQALENALRTLRPHTEGRLMVVFGHAGERDPANRPTMGRIAAELSDYFIISMDDPLHEDPTEIAYAIAARSSCRGREDVGAGLRRSTWTGCRRLRTLHRPCPAGRHGPPRRQGPRAPDAGRRRATPLERPRGGRARAGRTRLRGAVVRAHGAEVRPSLRCVTLGRRVVPCGEGGGR